VAPCWADGAVAFWCRESDAGDLSPQPPAVHALFVVFGVCSACAVPSRSFSSDELPGRSDCGGWSAGSPTTTATRSANCSIGVRLWCHAVCVVTWWIRIGPGVFSRAPSSRCGGLPAAISAGEPMSGRGSRRSSSGVSRTASRPRWRLRSPRRPGWVHSVRGGRRASRWNSPGFSGDILACPWDTLVSSTALMITLSQRMDFRRRDRRSGSDLGPPRPAGVSCRDGGRGSRGQGSKPLASTRNVRGCRVQAAGVVCCSVGRGRGGRRRSRA
jgi:hypothetical protein